MAKKIKVKVYDFFSYSLFYLKDRKYNYFKRRTKLFAKTKDYFPKIFSVFDWITLFVVFLSKFTYNLHCTILRPMKLVV